MTIKPLFFMAGMLALQLAAAQAIVTKVTFNKKEEPAVVAEFAYPNDLVEQTLYDDLKQRGFGKGKSTKGFTLFQAVQFKEISPDKIDLYVSSERKSKKEKDKSQVTVLVSKGYDNFIGNDTDAGTMQGTIRYLNGLNAKFEAADLDAKIAEQEDNLKKEETRFSRLLDDQSDLEKKKRKLEEDIINNKKDQEKQKTEVEKQRQVLTTLKARKKS